MHGVRFVGIYAAFSLRCPSRYKRSQTASGHNFGHSLHALELAPAPCKETDRKWEEGDDISVLEFKTTEYGRAKLAREPAALEAAVHAPANALPE